MAARAVELGQAALGLTDHGECNQHRAFYEACRARDVHPLLGMEGYWVNNLAEARGDGKRYNSEKVSHICLIAQNNQGLRNLWALSSVAYDNEHRFHKPWADPALLSQYSAGITASDGCLMTVLSKCVENGDTQGARDYYYGLLDIYGERLYSELHTWQYMDPVTDEQKRLNALMGEVNRAKVELATELGVPLVVVNDAHHVRPQDWEARELMWQFNTGKRNPDQDGEIGQKADHIMDEAEIHYWMARHGVRAEVVDAAIAHSSVIAADCHVTLEPTLAPPRLSQSDAEDFTALIKACEAAFKRRVLDGGLAAEPYYHRLESELALIGDKALAGYFRIVADYVGAAREGTWVRQVPGVGVQRQPILLGPARGSSGGSLVAWLLGITALDPLKYDLLFSRFLSPGRTSLPDIDVDFPQSALANMRAYLSGRYGSDHVCGIGTLSRSGPKQTLRDLGRALKIPYALTDQLNKMITALEAERDPEDDEVSWTEVMDRAGPDLRAAISAHPDLLTRMAQMSGLVRHTGVHAAGTLIAREPLLGAIPLRTRKDGTKEVVCTQLEMGDVEALGGVKFDLLGLRHLDTLTVARDLIYERHQVWIDYHGLGAGVPEGAQVITPDDWGLNNPAIWERVDAGQTTGIFQLEAPGATRIGQRFRPRSVLDLAVLISIIRPGVSDAGLLEPFLKRRAGTEAVSYDHPLMEPIVAETHGILVFQEQILRAAQELAGFTPEEAETLRKALGKKNAEVIAGLQEKFVVGCEGNAIPALSAQHIWGSIEAAGRYAFNRSHAVGYALIGAWELWTLHPYPQEYLTALLSTDPAGVNAYVRAAKRAGFPVAAPDINRSGAKFSVTLDHQILFGLESVMGVGAAAVKAIIAHRPYTGLADYLSRAGSGANKTTVEHLIKVGAFDALEGPGRRAALLRALQRHRILAKVAPNKRAKLTEDECDEIVADKLARFPDDYAIAIPDFADARVLWDLEAELMGCHATVDLLAPYQGMLEAEVLADPVAIEAIEAGATFSVGGLLTKIKYHTVAKGFMAGKQMAFLQLRFNEADFEVTVFSEVLGSVKPMLEINTPVVCRCRRDKRGAKVESLLRLDLLLANGKASGNGG